MTLLFPFLFCTFLYQHDAMAPSLIPIFFVICYKLVTNIIAINAPKSLPTLPTRPQMADPSKWLQQQRVTPAPHITGCC